MALVLANRVQETGTANTTVSFTLTGAVTGFQSFAVIGNTNTTYYSATDGSGNWEVGLGTYSTTGPTLTRTTVYASSNSGSAVTFSGAVNVFVTYPSGRSVNLDASGNVSALGTVSSGTWQGSTVGVAYGGTGVTSSSGANSVMLRDANQNVAVNRLNQSNTSTTATGGTTALTAGSSYIHTLVGTGNQTYTMPDATTLTTGVAFVFNNMATGTLTIQNYAAGAVGTIPSGGAGAVFLTDNSTTGGIWDIHAYLPEGVTFGTNAFNLGTSVISGGTWQGGTVQPGYGGTGLTTFAGANNALYSTGASTLTAGTLPVAAGGTGLTTYTLNGVVYASGTGTLATGSALTFDGTTLTVTGGASIDNASGAGFLVRNTTASTSGSSLISFQNKDGAGAFRTVARASGVTTSNGGNGDFLVETAYSGVLYKGLLVDSLSDVYFYNSSGAKDLRWDSVNQRLGVNNIAPTANLDVTGTANVSGALSAGSLAGSIATGSGASGTWSINISGNAATATTAANVNNGTLTLAVAGTGLSGSATFTANQAGNSTFTVTSNATSANTASTIVARDASGNFSAGTITASLSGNASTATTATTATNQSGGTINATTGTVTPNTTGVSTGFTVVNGDITTYRSGGTTGVIYLGNSGSKYLYYDGTSYSMPGGELYVNSNLALTAGNYNSYAPTLTGGGASGTWGINISGNAATATSATSATTATTASNSNLLNNLSSTQLFNNMGQNHNTYTDADAFTNFGTQFLQGTTNGPGAGGTQWYMIGMGLGNDYAYSNYAMQFAVPRTPTGGNPYISVRFREGGTWNSWAKIWAGYADSAGSATTADQIDSWPFRNTGSNAGTAADSLDSNGITYVASNISLFGQTDGALYSQAYSSAWQHQIFGDYRTGQIAIRGKNSGTWQSWRAVLDATNYTSYAPSLTGSGASGTWAINISGNAATATSATSATTATTAGTITSQANSATITASTAATANQIVLRDANADDYRRYGFAEYFNMSHGVSGATGDTIFYSSTDNYIRKNNATGFRASLNVPTRTGGDASGTWGINISGNAATATTATSATSATSATNATNVAITNDTTTNATYYPAFMTTTSGNAGVRVSSSKLTYNPSTGALSSTTVTGSSDERLKKNWRSFPSDVIEQLACVQSGIYDRNDTDAPVTQVGVSAQSLQKVIPDAVISDNEGMLSVAYGNAALVAAIELAKRVVEQEARINRLEAMMAKLIGD